MIRNRLTAFKNRLFRINDEEPLSKLSLCVIIALDLFILFVVFSGLHEHTRQLTSPWETVPSECRDVFVQENWTEANRISKLQKLVLSDYHHYSYPRTRRFDPSRIQKMHPLCEDVLLKIKAIAEDKQIFDLFKQREKLEKAKAQFTSGFKQSKEVYDTSLLEDIAENTGGQSQLPTIADSMKEKSRQIESFNSRILIIENQLNSDDKIRDLWAFIREGDGERRDRLVNDINHAEFWYPFKELLWQLLFLLPLFFLFYVWNVRSIRKNANLQVLISAHLLVISAIPILFKVLEVVLDLIPRHFFKKFFELLTALHIIAIWHYLVILASIGVALLAIYIIQKKIFNKHRLQLKRLTKGQCYHCGKKLPPDADICPFCGSSQQTDCPFCDQRTFVAGDFCTRCGKGLM